MPTPLPSDIRIRDVRYWFRDEQARTPLKFGGVVMSGVTYVRVKATVETRGGALADGWAGIFLATGWAWPTERVGPVERDTAMRQVVERYARVVAGYAGYAHPLDIGAETEPELRRLAKEVSGEMGLAEEMPVLTALVAGSPVDGAVHDAWGKANGISSYTGYGPEFTAKDLSAYLGPAFKGKYLTHYLRSTYAPRIPIFHLVGGLDKLRASEITPDDPQDGEPVSLDQYIARDGVYCLKVKLRGNDLPWDVERTLDVYRIGQEGLAAQGREELYLTADTNEICESPDYMVEYLRKLQEKSAEVYDAILYVEQPTHRDLERFPFRMDAVSKLKPVRPRAVRARESPRLVRHCPQNVQGSDPELAFLGSG